MNESVSLSLNMESFLEIIDFTKNSVSRDDLKPALQGVLLKIDSSQILGVSSLTVLVLINEISLIYQPVLLI